MKFILLNAIKSIRKSIKINGVIVLTLFVAYLFFFLSCCYIEDALQDLDSFKMKEMDQSIYYRIGNEIGMNQPDRLSKEELDQFFLQYEFIENITAAEYYFIDDKVSEISIGYYAIEENFYDLFFMNVVEGRYFTPEEFVDGSPVCILEKSGQDLRDIKIGDLIRLDENTELEVIGIIKRNADSGAVFVPQAAFQNDRTRDQYFQGYTVGAQLTDFSKRFDIGWSQIGFQGQLFTAEEFLNYGLQFLLARIIPILMISALLMIYALFNLINIMVSKMDEQKKSLGIRVALGATNRQIFLQFFFECLLLVLAAVALVFLLEPLTAQLIKTVINHHFGVFSILSVLVVSVVSAFFISKALFRKFRTANIVEIIRKP